MPRSRPPSKRHPRYGGSSKRQAGSRRRSSGRGRVKPSDDAGLVRLQKVLAAAGVGSRRQCEELIREGRVDVDGTIVTELGTRVDPFQHRIRLDGEVVSRPKRRLYFLINKPVGVISTTQDPSGRPRVIDLAPTHERMFTVGRLDKSSEGLILATNDGQLTDLLTHPRYGIEKTYWALVAGSVSPEAVAKLERGVHLAEGFAHAKRVIVRKAHKQSTVLEIVLDEGRNREVRRLLARIGHKVLKLRRIAIGPLRLGNLKPGESRALARDEVESLYEAARQKRRQQGRKHPPKSKGAPHGDGEIKPLIDHSLTPDDLAADELNPLCPTAAEFTSDESAHDRSWHELPGDGFPADSETAPPAAPVDLSPIVPGKLGRRSEGTVIGGEARGRKPFRHSRCSERHVQGGKPRHSQSRRKRRRP